MNIEELILWIGIPLLILCVGMFWYQWYKLMKWIFKRD